MESFQQLSRDPLFATVFCAACVVAYLLFMMACQYLLRQLSKLETWLRQRYVVVNADKLNWGRLAYRATVRELAAAPRIEKDGVTWVLVPRRWL